MQLRLRTVCPLFLIARLVPVTEDIVFPGALAAFRLRSASNPSPARFQAEGNDVWLLPDKRSHLRKRRRQRTMCEAAGTGLVVSARARWSDPPPVRKCARGQTQKSRALRSASPDARDRARPQPRSASPNHRPASMKKGEEPSPVPALSSSSELVEHSPAHGVNHPVRQVRRQGVVVALVEREVT